MFQNSKTHVHVMILIRMSKKFCLLTRQTFLIQRSHTRRNVPERNVPWTYPSARSAVVFTRVLVVGTCYKTVSRG